MRLGVPDKYEMPSVEFEITVNKILWEGQLRLLLQTSVDETGHFKRREITEAIFKLAQVPKDELHCNEVNKVMDWLSVHPDVTHPNKYPVDSMKRNRFDDSSEPFHVQMIQEIVSFANCLTSLKENIARREKLIEERSKEKEEKKKDKQAAKRKKSEKKECEKELSEEE
jgi:hypothetical protein